MDGETYLSEARFWSYIRTCAEESKEIAADFTPQRRGEVTSYRGNWYLVGSLVTRETSGGARPSLPL